MFDLLERDTLITDFVGILCIHSAFIGAAILTSV